MLKQKYIWAGASLFLIGGAVQFSWAQGASGWLPFKVLHIRQPANIELPTGAFHLYRPLARIEMVKLLKPPQSDA